MGFFANLFGLGNSSMGRSPRDALAGLGRSALPENDEQALDRYRYMLRTAPPEALEAAHAEAFAKLNPEQRRLVMERLTDEAPRAERAAVAATSADDPRAMALAATRAELRSPGTMERALGGTGLGMGASLLSSFAMGFAGSMVAQSLFSSLGSLGDASLADAGAADELSAEETEPQSDADDGDFYAGDFEA